MFLTSCGRPSAAEQRRIEKHHRDSIALVEQERSLAFYQAQLDLLLPQADSLLPLFRYERNERYQDHGYYVRSCRGKDFRLLVRDDGREPVLAYYNGRRIDNVEALQFPEAHYLNDGDRQAIEQAHHLALVMADIRELEKRIQRTSLEIEKYQRRLEKRSSKK